MGHGFNSYGQSPTIYGGEKMKREEIALKVAWSFLGTPYQWGGDDPMAGFDCSGFIIEILKSVGLIQRSLDMTAAGIYRHFKELGCLETVPASCRLAFWKVINTGRIRHIEFCIDEVHTIGASGGGSATISVKEAIKRNAYIKVRKIDTHDKSLHGFVDPFKCTSL